jgi:hypothetical protein
MQDEHRGEQPSHNDEKHQYGQAQLDVVRHFLKTLFQQQNGCKKTASDRVVKATVRQPLATTAATIVQDQTQPT